jgi:hypothetical protein
MGVTQTILETLDNNMLKWYGYILRMEDKRWPENNELVTGRRRRGRPEVEWEKESERVRKQRN